MSGDGDGQAAGVVTVNGRPQPKITREERLKIEAHNRALLERELLEKRFVFESRPFEAQIQYSNFCNMSCVMCHDGANPPLHKMSPKILQKVGEQIAPSVSVVIPFDGSEPLIVAWDETRQMAEEYSLELSLTTNAQFLDEEKFFELKDITREMLVSIDTHYPELFEKIRPGSKPEKVFENLPRAAALCKEHGLEVWANIVFMTLNGPTLDETIAYLADSGLQTMNVLQMIDVNGRSGHLDPTLHFSADYVEWIKQRCIQVAREKHVRLIWCVAGWERYDFRVEKIASKPQRDWAARWETRMKRFVPGYCMTVWNRLHVNSRGECTPCCYATSGDLVLGDLRKQDFDEIWNSPNAVDLRRSMATWDYPSLCSTCYFTDKPAPEAYLPFVDDVLEVLGRRKHSVDPSLVVTGPEHMLRTTDAPTITIEGTVDDTVDSWVLALSLGGESEHLEICPLERVADAAGLEFALPAETWEKLGTNLGYWWAVFAVNVNEKEPVLRSSEIRCVVRHEPIARVEGSSLRYPDQVLPVADLGGAKVPGWEAPDVLPERPEVDNPRLRERRTRHIRRQQEAAEAAANGQVKDEYQELVERIKLIVRSSVPVDATVVVASKGDDQLLDLECGEAWHFPATPDGTWVGYNPPDAAWAIEQLELARARGADYLLLPATAFWWLEQYPEFAQHLLKRCPQIVDDESCAIYTLARFPALYGRDREETVRSHQRHVDTLVREALGPVPALELQPQGDPPATAP
ncbi:MAG TPA: radical SAM protein [Solirubrobacterales bacterium]|nr:radical SAM protein [Solirubrobacterales bacterium]